MSIYNILHIPLTGDINVTASGQECADWQLVHSLAYAAGDLDTAALTDPWSFYAYGYSDIGNKCR